MTRTLVVGLDGATETILEPLLEAGVMPFLARFSRAGAGGHLLSTPNPLTPPAFTTMMTGRSPGHHGVFDFIRAEERDGLLYFSLVNARDVQAETIWQIVSRHGGSVTALNFIAMYPPRPVRGYVVPGFVTSRNLRLNVFPRGLYDELKSIGFSLKEASWDLEEGRKPLLGALGVQEYEDVVRYHIRRERQWFEVTRYLMERYPCDLTAVVFDGVDKLQHLVWRFLDPGCATSGAPDWDGRVRELCHEYFRALDGYLAELVRLAGEDTRVFILSDHGFGPTDEVVKVNAWLAERGHLAWADGTPDDDSESLTAASLKAHYDSIDWTRTTAYARTSSANGIYIRVAGPGRRGGIPPADYLAFREQLRQELLAWLDERGPVIAAARTREEAFPGPQSGAAPDLTLTLRDGGFLSILKSGQTVRPRAEVAGTHRPEGIVRADGPGIRRGARLSPQSILDVAPTLLYSLDLPVPEDLEGRVMTDLFAPEALAAAPVRVEGRTAGAEEARETTAGGAMAPEEEAQVLERLKALGYL